MIGNPYNVTKYQRFCKPIGDSMGIKIAWLASQSAHMLPSQNVYVITIDQSCTHDVMF